MLILPKRVGILPKCDTNFLIVFMVIRFYLCLLNKLTRDFSVALSNCYSVVNKLYNVMKIVAKIFGLVPIRVEITNTGFKLKMLQLTIQFY